MPWRGACCVPALAHAALLTARDTAEGAVSGEGVELRGQSEVEVERAIVTGGQEVRWHDPGSRRRVRR